ncbi:prospero homeobox protein 1-like [Nerophis ophidion]|uniref:prospero homeobox protein 1-like n=1 Tax=Nerophis ophidion TaxID=159077 RepID=UPI002AE05A8B|nr:prospero homeobox protein 1-like [Nerophis ophidion]
MPDHDSAALLTKQTKRRRVDIGVKRTVGGGVTGVLLDGMNLQSHSPDRDGDLSLAARGHGDGEKSNVLRKLLKRANSYEDTMMPFPGATIISQLLKSNMGKNGGSDSGFQGSGALSSGGSEIQAEDGCSNASSQDRDSPSNCISPGPTLPLVPPSFGRPTSNLSSHTTVQPLSLTSFDFDRLSDEHLRAKRARVENIIRGMSHSPLVQSSIAGDHGKESNFDNESSPGSRAGGVSAGEVYRENKRKQRLPQQQQSFPQLVCSRQEQRQEERRQLKLQLEDMQKQLRQLQEKFYQIYDSETEEEDEIHDRGEGDRGGERDEDGNLSEDSIRSDGLEERHRDRGRRRHDELSELDPGLFLDRARALLRQQALMDGEMVDDVEGRSQEEEEERMVKRKGGRQLAETLKQELNCAVSQVVDTVVKGFSSPKQAVSHHHGCHSSTPAAPSSSSNSSSSCPPLFGPLPSLTPDSRFGGGALALSLNGDGSPTSNYHSSNQRLHCFGDIIAPSPLDSFNGLSGRLSSVPTPNDQTEALPLVVRKSGGAGGCEENGNPPLPPPPPPHHPSLPLTATLGFSPPSFRHPFPLPLMGYPFHSPLGSHGGGYTTAAKDNNHHHHHHHHIRSSPDSMDMTRETLSLRTKMANLGGGHLGHHHNRQSSPSQHGPESLSLSLIKSECGDLADIADISPYSSSTIQEGLSPNHLKKAKLMFFYTRYPSSNMLKMFFSDVKVSSVAVSQVTPRHAAKCQPVCTGSNFTYLPSSVFLNTFIPSHAISLMLLSTSALVPVLASCASHHLFVPLLHKLPFWFSTPCLSPDFDVSLLPWIICLPHGLSYFFALNNIWFRHIQNVSKFKCSVFCVSSRRQSAINAPGLMNRDSIKSLTADFSSSEHSPVYIDDELLGHVDLEDQVVGYAPVSQMSVVVSYLHAQELGAAYDPYCCAIDEDWSVNGLVTPEVDDDLLGLVDVQDQVVGSAPVNQMSVIVSYIHAQKLGVAYHEVPVCLFLLIEAKVNKKR